MRLAVLSCIILLTTGCVAPVPSYQVSSANASLRGFAKQVRVVSRGSTFKDDGSIVCRAAAVVQLPNGQSFSAYLTSALVKELTAAGLANESSDVQLIVTWQKVDFSTSLGATNWQIDAMYELDGQKIPVSTVYHDRSSYLGAKACDNIATYFQKAVSTHFNQLFSDPIFRQGIKAEK